MAKVPVEGVFIEVTTAALKRVVSGAVGAGLELDWCFDTLDDIVATMRREAQSEAAADRPSPGA